MRSRWFSVRWSPLYAPSPPSSSFQLQNVLCSPGGGGGGGGGGEDVCPGFEAPGGDRRARARSLRVRINLCLRSERASSFLPSLRRLRSTGPASRPASPTPPQLSSIFHSSLFLLLGDIQMERDVVGLAENRELQLLL